MQYNYFSLLDTITIGDKKLKNIFKRINILDTYITENPDIYLDYYVKEGDKLEDLSLKWYNDKNMFWVICICNNMFDVYYDWPMNNYELYDYADVKLNDIIDNLSLDTGETKEDKFLSLYGQTGETYEICYKRILEDIYTDLYTENDIKRDIKYVNPVYIQKFLIDVQTILS